MPRAEIEALRAASRNLRERETRANKQEYDAGVAALVERMAEVDVDGIVSETSCSWTSSTSTTAVVRA